MNIKIQRCSGEMYWYKEFVGQIFEVNRTPRGLFIKNSKGLMFTDHKDIEILPEENIVDVKLIRKY